VTKETKPDWAKRYVLKRQEIARANNGAGCSLQSVAQETAGARGMTYDFGEWGAWVRLGQVGLAAVRHGLPLHYRLLLRAGRWEVYWLSSPP
jgi:hypothetical protein